MTLDPEQLRRSMRAWSSGVTIVTAAQAGEQHGMTVSSFTSISLDPPLIIISLHTGSRTHRLIEASGVFAINILSSQQQALSERFAGAASPDANRFHGVPTTLLQTGVPTLTEALACLDCQVRQVIPAGMNTLFLGEVVAVQGSGEGEPLVYHNQKYGTFLSNQQG